MPSAYVTASIHLIDIPIEEPSRRKNFYEWSHSSVAIATEAIGLV